MTAVTHNPPVERQSRSPSPAAAPPIPLTPGPRASALQKLYTDAVAHILRTCSYSNFSSCFPTPAQQVPQALKHLHEQFTRHLGKEMGEEFEKILEERDVVKSLNELDRLVEEGRRRKTEAGEGAKAPVPLHTLPAEKLYLSHLQPSLMQQSQVMRDKQSALHNDNVERLQRVLEQRRQIATMVQGLEAAVADVEASVAALKPEELDDIRDETRDIDEEMRTTA